MEQEGKPGNRHLQELDLLRRRVVELEAAEVKNRQEIRRLQQIAAAAAENEDRFRILVDQSFDGIFVHEDFRIVELNTRLSEITGYSRAELLGLRVIDLFTPDSQKRIRDYISSGRGGYYELELQRKDGRLVQVESFGAPCTFRGRQARIAALRDISARKQYEAELNNYKEHLEKLVAERTAALEQANARLREKIQEYRRAEQALGESELRLRNIFEGVPVGLGLRDLQGFFLESNPALSDMLGYSRDELRTQSLETITHPEDERLHRKLFGDLLAGKRDFIQLELRFFQKAGGLRWGRMHESLIRGLDGSPAYSLLIIQDITEEKKAQEELATYQENLRSLASELALTEERERRRLAEFLHDDVIQTLALIKIKLGELQQELGQSSQADRLAEARNFLDQAILSCRNLTFELGLSILYEEGLVEAVEQLGRQFQAKYGLAVRVSQDGQPKPLAEGTRLILFRTIRELLTNIVKHARARVAEISFQREGDLLRIHVRDDGIGFEAGQKLSPSAPASGFGLFSVRERLGHLGGHLEVNSAPGCGTRITICLPLSRMEEFPPVW